MAALRSNREQRLLDRAFRFERALGDATQHLQLLSREDGVRRRLRRFPALIAHHEQLPGDGGEQRERVLECGPALKLSLLERTSGLERLEVLLDLPAPAVPVDHRLDLL